MYTLKTIKIKIVICKSYFSYALGGKKCTTLLMERGLEGEAQCSVQDPTYGTIQNDTMMRSA